MEEEDFVNAGFMRVSGSRNCFWESWVWDLEMMTFLEFGFGPVFPGKEERMQK